MQAALYEQAQHHHFDGYVIGPLVDDGKYFGILTYYRGDVAMVSITTYANGFPNAAGKLSMLMDKCIDDLRNGRQQLPPDGETTIEY